jgi:hypothetical protein
MLMKRSGRQGACRQASDRPVASDAGILKHRFHTPWLCDRERHRNPVRGSGEEMHQRAAGHEQHFVPSRPFNECRNSIFAKCVGYCYGVL